MLRTPWSDRIFDVRIRYWMKCAACNFGQLIECEGQWRANGSSMSSMRMEQASDEASMMMTFQFSICKAVVVDGRIASNIWLVDVFLAVRSPLTEFF